MTQNQWERLKHGARGRHRQILAAQVRAQRIQLGLADVPPLKRVAIQATRFRHGRDLDIDNLYGGLKALLDVLVVGSSRNPHGQGLILDDRPTVLHTLDAEQIDLRGTDEPERTELHLCGHT